MGDVPLMTAFNVMLNDVTAEDCSDRQIAGIIVWRALTANACRHARACMGTEAPGLTVPWSRSFTARLWTNSATLIITALAIQAEAASRGAAEENRKAAHHDRRAQAYRQAAQANQAAAVRERAAAARYRAAAGSCDSSDEGQAQAASNMAMAAERDADAVTRERHAQAESTVAEEEEKKAAQAHGKAARYLAWGAAALDAKAEGNRVVATEAPIIAVIGQAITTAGGIQEMPRDKRYLERAGAGGGQ